MASQPILWILGLVSPATGTHPEILQFQLIAQTARHDPSQASLIKKPRLSADPLVWHTLEALVTTQLYHPSPGLGNSLNSDKKLILQLVLVMLQPALP